MQFSEQVSVRSSTVQFVLTALLVATVSSRSVPAQQETPSPRKAVPASHPDGHTPMSDAAIGEAIEDEFRSDAAVPSALVLAICHDGVVTLRGTVDDILAADRAAAIARTVRGVRAVVNRVRVVPPADLDADTLRGNVQGALLADPATDAFEIGVAVDDHGRVTLDGKVQSWAERELCARVAKGVAGVTALDNAIEVEFREERDDAEIAAEIAARLRWDVLVDDGQVDVRCTDGAVTLSGTVGSAAERYRATHLARVAGVDSVAFDDLTVERWARDPLLRASKYAVRSDEQIRDAVEAALLQDPRVASFEVATDVDAGVVTLRGTVDNLKARRAAAADANDTVGVIRVRNRIRVEPDEERDGGLVAAEVRAALMRDPYVDGSNVRVSAHNGVVRLYGTVDSDFERAQADDAAARTNGVLTVENYLQPRTRLLVSYDPYVDEWPVHEYPTYLHQPIATFTADDEIRQCVRRELWLSPFVDDDRVEVSVDDGTVTLRGTVGSRTERISAVENAYDGGAVWVVDRLDVPDTPKISPEK